MYLARQLCPVASPTMHQPTSSSLLKRLWATYDMNARHAVLARHLRAWRRLLSLRHIDTTHALLLRQRRDRILRRAVLRVEAMQVRRHVHHWQGVTHHRRQCVAGLLQCIHTYMLMRAMQKWRRMAWHECLVDHLDVWCDVLVHRRAVKRLSGLLRSIRKKKLCRGLARWQLATAAARWHVHHHRSTSISTLPYRVSL
ncbi:Aste57867_24515 [Aphanomyces stellatus]|uniref:Aste57867_24515 protein n=1 Tax=Aphanomyces stellatus TaxID=120398 RepID=A0A485LQP6_9STRA|nr:hypothetical protein As57867_024438 [Aphanomyces stellatus]VFU01154.1 Aste57867_24515 [Aphanomyces stellatus]